MDLQVLTGNVEYICACKATNMNKEETLNPKMRSDKNSEMEASHHLYNSHFTPVV